MASPEEWSLLEYARFHGIAKNPLDEPEISQKDLLPLIDDQQHIKNQTSLPDISLDCINEQLQGKRLSIDKVTAKFVSSIVYRSENDETRDCDVVLRPEKRLKLELPILQTDHELDISLLKNGQSPKIDVRKLPSFEFQSNMPDMSGPDEGIANHEKLYRSIRREKLSVSKETLQAVKSIVGFQTNLEEPGCVYSLQLTETDDEEFMEPLTSTPASRSASPDASMVCSNNATFKTHVATQDETSTIGKTQSTVDEEFEDVFASLIGSRAFDDEGAETNDQPISDDKSLRMVMPALDCSISVPWQGKVSLTDIEEETRQLMLPIAKANLHYWSVSKLERKLSWVPFPLSQSKISLDEELEKDEDVVCFLNDSIFDLMEGNSVESALGLNYRLELDEEEEEQLSIGDDANEETSDTPSLSSRKPILRPWLSPNVLDKFGDAHQKIPKISDTKKQTAVSTSREHSRLNPGNFSLLNLDLFIALDTGHTPESFKSCEGNIKTSSFVTEMKEHQVHSPITSLSRKRNPQVSRTYTSLGSRTPPQIVPDHIPLQNLYPIMVSTNTLIHHRSVITNLTNLYPKIAILERTFGNACTLFKTDQYHTTLSTTYCHTEADITLSPSTGVIFINVSKLNQKPLPGVRTSQSSSSLPPQQHVRQTAPLYECLVVIITPITPTVVSVDETRTANEFISFCTSLATPDASEQPQDVRAIFIRGPPCEIASYVGALICIEAEAASSLQCFGSKTADEEGRCEQSVIDEHETQSELFLRRAGMNTYAAQAVLAELKSTFVPDSRADTKRDYERRSEDASSRTSGLFVHSSSSPIKWQGRRSKKAETERGFAIIDVDEDELERTCVSEFVNMSQAERERRFSKILGGTKVLTNVLKIMDAPPRIR